MTVLTPLPRSTVRGGCAARSRRRPRASPRRSELRLLRVVGASAREALGDNLRRLWVPLLERLWRTTSQGASKGSKLWGATNFEVPQECQTCERKHTSQTFATCFIFGFLFTTRTNKTGCASLADILHEVNIT